MNKVYYQVKIYTANGNVSTGDEELGFLFQNTGAVNVRLNGYLLQPFDTLDTRQFGEKDVTKWQIIFQADQAGVKELTILVKALTN